MYATKLGLFFAYFYIAPMKLVSPYRYAKMKGVSTQYIYKLIKEGRLSKVKRKMPDGSHKEFIDLDKFPIE